MEFYIQSNSVMNSFKFPMTKSLSHCLTELFPIYRPVVPGCAGCAIAHPYFGRSVNPISIRGTAYADLITTGTPGFSDLPTALIYQSKH